jgi:uncharacterized protein YdhG (YjbR/CyaY superfamily)
MSREHVVGGAPADFRDYSARFPAGVRARLTEVRRAIHGAVPDAEERISYGMPGFAIGRRVVSFGAFANHVGFYPGAAAIRAFARELDRYETAKGSVRFPFDEPLPLELIARMVRFTASNGEGNTSASS